MTTRDRIEGLLAALSRVLIRAGAGDAVIARLGDVARELRGGGRA